MRILISKKPETIAKKYGRDTYNKHLGCLMSAPRSSYNTRMNIVWGMDNGRFVCLDNGEWDISRWDKGAFIGMMERKRGIPGCKFVVAPDVLLDAPSTLNEFWQWRDFIAAHGYPVAFALQDDCTPDEVPWGACDALFIGGSNAFKFSAVCRFIIHTAKRFEMWAHWGRGSTPGFIHYARAIGCDSVDSSAFARFTNDRLPKALQILKHKQHTLFDWSPK